MILVDTSVWVDFLRAGSDRLATLLLDDQVLCHPFIIGEIACGSLKDRQKTISLLQALPKAERADDEEALQFLDGKELYGRGLGWIDVHLLVSTALSRATIWTLDRPLKAVAELLGICA